MKKKFLLLGGSGFLGFGVLKFLASNGMDVRCVMRSFPDPKFVFNNIEYCIGDINDETFLNEVLQEVDVVLDFISTSMPNTKGHSLENEITITLKHLDYLLSAMVKNRVYKLVYPSSGGAIYGDKCDGIATETDTLAPRTPYGVGKQMSEDIIKYYHVTCGISACILRIGNLYGAEILRNKPQGVIDVFIQNALLNKPIVIWGNAATNIRDYIYIDDVAAAVVKLLDNIANGVMVYNVSSGFGYSILDIIMSIEKLLHRKLNIVYEKNSNSGVNRIVLSNDKLAKDIEWKPLVFLDEGIKRTIEYKKRLLGL